jgi:hypothetical protein
MHVYIKLAARTGIFNIACIGILCARAREIAQAGLLNVQTKFMS